VTRLFVALWPPDHVIEHVRSLPRDGWEGVRWVPEPNWHVTLRFIGEADPTAVSHALSKAPLPGTTAVVGSRLETLARTSLVVRVHGVDQLAHAVLQATSTIGRIEHDRPFRGHLTVARTRGGRSIVGGRSGARHTDQAPASVEFDVSEVALVASTLSPAGATYATLATFTTTAGGAR
jgi:2'-5' RNA ligase